MNNDSLLIKVTEGLYSNALQHHSVILYRENLKFFSWLLEKNPDFYNFLNSPFNSNACNKIFIDIFFYDNLLIRFFMEGIFYVCDLFII